MPDPFPQDLAGNLVASTGLPPSTALRVIADVTTYFGETVEEFVRRRHAELRRGPPLAADGEFPPPQGNETLVNRRPSVLYVGGMEARKNFAILHDAWQAAFPRGEVDLVAVSSDAMPAGVVRMSGVSRERLRDLYRQALCVAVPSLYEGFGLPALEALACGAPVIASAAGALPEVCGDAAVYADPQSADAWSAAMQRLYASPEKRVAMRRAALERAALFSWERTARETLAVLRAP